MGQKFVYDPATDRLVPKGEPEHKSGVTIIRDTPGVVEPINRTWLEGRAARREYCKRNNVREVEPSEFRNTGFKSKSFQRRFGLRNSEG